MDNSGSPKNKKTPCIAVFGTGSEVGKSVVATALCRYFADKGISVAPFKAQNMSNNSGVTPEGLEMGRAQIVQAEAARISPCVDMNPVLLKPTDDAGAQVVLLGKVLENSTAAEYHKKKDQLFSTACDALDRLRKKHDLIVMEGAGSCAEVNLMPHDIVNFRMAEYADASVILVADIHKGGVFAQIIGTLECLAQEQRDRIAGFIINRFRGDMRLFEEGVRWIERKTQKKVFGVLPYYTRFRIEAEDSVVIENPVKVSPEKDSVPAVAVIRVPHISNFTDFDPLSDEKNLKVHFIESVQELSEFKAVILPGSKNTRFDLNWLNITGWSEKIKAYAEKGGHILGICGGYQMMGHYVHDPEGLEGSPGTTEGLSLLPVKTVLRSPKTTTLTRFSWKDSTGAGYEIHSGQTERLKGDALFTVTERNNMPCQNCEDGCASDDLRIMGTYIHGLFDSPEIKDRWLKTIPVGLPHRGAAIPGVPHPSAAKDKVYTLLAEHFKAHINIKQIEETLGIEKKALK